ncbi:MAG: hemerythrin family protein [Spirochaetaceae bacterium]|nr:hemerythrin family protein [Spirochaetaceae bacterium]
MNNENELRYGLAWDDSLLLGNELVDKQHQQLFKQVSDLIVACEEGRNIAKLHDTLMFLVDYAVRHFSDEEVLQLECGYPGYESHKKMHDDFKETVGELVQRFKDSGSSAELSRDLNKILARWLVKHIKNEDKKIGDHIRSLKAGEAEKK